MKFRATHIESSIQEPTKNASHTSIGQKKDDIMETAEIKKESYSFCEVYGAEKVLELAIGQKENLYVSEGLLNSASDAKGYAIELNEGYFLSHCGILPNGVLVAECYDASDNWSSWRIEPNGVCKLS
jgi:hypothetical protein